MEQMSTEQYAKLIGRNRQYVHYQAKKTDHKLPGVANHNWVAGRLILTVDKNKVKKVQ